MLTCDVCGDAKSLGPMAVNDFAVTAQQGSRW
jgi:hypothetical protein